MRILRIGGSNVTAIFVFEPLAVDEQSRRVPDDLPIAAPERDTLEKILRASGYAIVAIDADTARSAAPGASDEAQLRAEVETLVNEADDSEVARLEAAATAEPADGLDERFWGRGPDSVAAARAVFADLSDQFAQRRELAANSIGRMVRLSFSASLHKASPRNWHRRS